MSACEALPNLNVNGRLECIAGASSSGEAECLADCCADQFSAVVNPTLACIGK